MKQMIAMFVILFTMSSAMGQEKIKATLETRKNSIIGGYITNVELKLVTSYGILKVPLSDVAEIEIGYHVDKDTAQIIATNLIALESSHYKNRILAEQELMRLQQYSYLPLRKHKFKSAEGVVRAYDLLSNMDASFVISQDMDIVHLSNGSKIVCRLEISEFVMTSTEFEKISVNIQYSRNLKFFR